MRPEDINGACGDDMFRQTVPYMSCGNWNTVARSPTVDTRLRPNGRLTMIKQQYRKSSRYHQLL